MAGTSQRRSGWSQYPPFSQDLQHHRREFRHNEARSTSAHTYMYGTAAKDVVQASGFKLVSAEWSDLRYSDTLTAHDDIRFANRGIGGRPARLLIATALMEPQTVTSTWGTPTGARNQTPIRLIAADPSWSGCKWSAVSRHPLAYTTWQRVLSQPPMEPNNSLVIIHMTGATKQATLHRLARTVQAMGGSGVIFDLPTHTETAASPRPMRRMTSGSRCTT
jgi:hypothetical protein